MLSHIQKDSGRIHRHDQSFISDAASSNAHVSYPNTDAKPEAKQAKLWRTQRSWSHGAGHEVPTAWGAAVAGQDIAGA